MKKQALPFLLLAMLILLLVALPSIACSDVSGLCKDSCAVVDRGQSGNCRWTRYACDRSCFVDGERQVVKTWEKTERVCEP